VPERLHLACAKEYGFADVYTNDRHMLLGAPLFGLRGVNLPREALGSLASLPAAF
jgi:hypothetical protein